MKTLLSILLSLSLLGNLWVYKMLKRSSSQYQLDSIKLDLLTENYFQISRCIDLSIDSNVTIRSLNNKIQNSDSLLRRYDYLIYFSELNCMECLKNVQDNILAKSQKKIGLIGNYDSSIKITAICNRLKFEKEHVYFVHEPLFDNKNVTDLNKPFLFGYDKEHNKTKMVLVPVKEISTIQEKFIKNEDTF